MNKTVLLVGSSGGLGRAIANELSRKGYRLALHYYKNKPEYVGSSDKTYCADITREDEVRELIAQVISDFGTIDFVINNAGISKSEMSWKTSADSWNQTLGVNLTGPFYVAKHVLPHMRENASGRIIFISSVVAEVGFPGTSAYAASKAGLIGLTKTLAREVAQKNITVNCIAPGYFSTGMIQDVTPEIQEQLKKQIPIGRLGDPAEIVALIEYIFSEKSAYLTGQTIGLNGGLMMR